MLSIGEFARYAGISVRMLRHYDAEGLLRPAHVDPVSGYRSYTAAQFPRINRLVALKDLGFTLAQVGRILDGGVEADELRGMLRLRREELAARIEDDERRLASVEARLRSIEREGLMSELEYVEKPLPAVRLATVEATAESVGEIGPTVGALFAELGGHLEAGELTANGPATASYDVRPGRVGVGITVGWPTARTDQAPGRVAIVEVPAVARALTLVHHGPMSDVGSAWQALETEVQRRGLDGEGPGREIYLQADPDDPTAWVTELQQPLA